MQLCVRQTDWGEVQTSNIEELLKNVASHLNRLLRTPFEGRIIVTPTPLGGPPCTLYRESLTDPIVIHLSARDRYWCQYAYQFSHEFCHVLSGYERLRDNPNNWFHEAICELASVFTLRRMAESWITDPPYSNWASYVQALNDYVQELLSRPEHKLPEAMTLPDWLSSHEETMRKDEYQREKNAAVAYSLLPIFEHYPAGWNTIRNLPTSSGGLEEYFADWHSSVDTADKPFVVSLSQASGYSIDA